MTRRVLKSFHWITNEENGRILKLAIKWLVTLALPLFGFVGKGLFDAYRAAHSQGDLVSGLFLSYFPWLKGRSGRWDPMLAGAAVAFAMLALAIAGLAARIAGQAWRSTRPANLPEDLYGRPTANARKIVESAAESPEEYKIVGGVIEIARHPFIVCDPAISGWDCMVGYGAAGGVRIEHDHGLRFVADETLIEGIEGPAGVSNRKYALVETPVDYMDAASGLCLKVRATDYHTIKRFSSLTHGDANTTIRHRLGSIFPELQQIPSSLCLHFLVQLADGSILCMLRRGNSDYSQGLVSMTAEEQLSEEDLRAGPEQAMNHWFRRAVCEEIFPLRANGSGELERNWREIEREVSAMRVFSVVYEEEYANYSLFGYVRLNLDAEEYRERFDQLARRYAAGRDKEGRYYLMRKQDAVDFAVHGKGMVSSIWGDSQTHACGEDEFYRPHLSSRYRVLTFLLSVGAIDGRKPPTQAGDASRRLIDRLNAELIRVEADRDALRARLKQHLRETHHDRAPVNAEA